VAPRWPPTECASASAGLRTAPAAAAAPSRCRPAHHCRSARVVRHVRQADPGHQILQAVRQVMVGAWAWACAYARRRRGDGQPRLKRRAHLTPRRPSRVAGPYSPCTAGPLSACALAIVNPWPVNFLAQDAAAAQSAGMGAPRRTAISAWLGDRDRMHALHTRRALSFRVFGGHAALCSGLPGPRRATSSQLSSRTPHAPLPAAKDALHRACARSEGTRCTRTFPRQFIGFHHFHFSPVSIYLGLGPSAPSPARAPLLTALPQLTAHRHVPDPPGPAQGCQGEQPGAVGPGP
jgi:hypothetical protein